MNIANKKVKDAIASLINSHPLYAGILIQQKFEECNDSAVCPTFQVNGETFMYNGNFANTLSFDECKGVCAHEGAHLLALHHCRMGSRDAKIWNEATDYAINWQLANKEQFKLPKGALQNARFADKSSEDIYRTLFAEKAKEQSQNQGKPAQGGSQGSQGQGSQGQTPSTGQQPGSNSQFGQGSQPSFGQVMPAQGKSPKDVEAKTKVQIEKAVSIARQAGALSADGERAIKRGIAPRFDWREVLHRFFREVTQNDYSFSQPNKRFAHTGIILPSLRSRDIGRIVLAVDTSGSVSTAEVSAMVGEMQNCLESYCENGLSQPLTVIYCDSRIQGIDELTSGDLPQPKGGGGTKFAPVFDHLGNDLDGAACLVYLTDGETSESLASLASLAPSYPVLWGLITDNQAFAANVPFGEVVKVDLAA